MKKTVRRRKDFLPQTSERAPISGALRKESRPWDGQTEQRTEKPLGESFQHHQEETTHS